MHMPIKRNIQRVCTYSILFGSHSIQFNFNSNLFTWKSHAGLKFHFGQNDRYGIHTILTSISPQFMWTQVKSWLNIEVRFSTEMKSHTSLSSFRLSFERISFHWSFSYWGSCFSAKTKISTLRNAFSIYGLVLFGFS